MYCKSSTIGYTTNSVYYNIVDGHPEYYDTVRGEPIPEKYNEVIGLLKSKVSVIYHAPKQKTKEFNTIVIENIRNENGKIAKINLYGNTFNKIINASFQFDTYLNYLKNATRYLFQLMQDNPNRVIFLKTEENTAFSGMQKHLNEAISQKNPNIDLFLNFINKFQINSSLSMKMFQDATNSFNISITNYDDMSLKERYTSFNTIINKLEYLDLKNLKNKMETIDTNDDEENKIKLYELLNSKNKSQIANAYETEESINPSLTLEDDLYYLFSRGLDDQIAATEDDALEGGYYLEDYENAQRKNFIDYIRTFIKPNLQGYALRQQCLMFVDIDKERNEIINNLLQVYDLIGQQLDGSGVILILLNFILA